MKLAILGSRGLRAKNIDDYVTDGVTEVVSGGARGVDRDAADWARERGIRLTEFLPEYARYGKAAPLKRNELIAEYADEALVFWDGVSRGTEYTVKCFKKRGKSVCTVLINAGK